nr:immunoglobulin light chain junction region [Macaca mulatta]MOV76508.1 immunoglobulin light chain junction region [Macaca mulatta]MOX54341.1 immunoglobulin light chain junction region [Macaca mulatta]
CQQYNDFLFTF